MYSHSTTWPGHLCAIHQHRVTVPLCPTVLDHVSKAGSQTDALLSGRALSPPLYMHRVRIRNTTARNVEALTETEKPANSSPATTQPLPSRFILPRHDSKLSKSVDRAFPSPSSNEVSTHHALMSTSRFKSARYTHQPCFGTRIVDRRHHGVPSLAGFVRVFPPTRPWQ